jgi:diaminopropionate ammonia-lyase
MPLSFPSLSFRLALNPGEAPHDEYGPRQAAVLSEQGLREARRCISAWPGYAPTPLLRLAGLAEELGIGRLHYKQEGERFGLRSFKPLGGAYAVQRCLMRVVAAQTGSEDIDPLEILGGDHADIVSGITVTAATDGNHGRSVAWGARMFGCRCVIYINEAVSEAREQAIAAYGAEVRRNPGSYDDAVRQAFETARRQGWHVIPDTSDGEIVEAPRDVMQGYAVMAAEVIEQLPQGRAPTHVFLQAGVGGMAAAVCAEFWRAFGTSRPMTVLVEPEQAACWFASLAEGRPTAVTGDIDSFMGGLACGEISRLAWEILQPGAHAAVGIRDAAAEATMRLLAEGRGSDPPLVGGESGVAGLAGLITSALDPDARQTLRLDATSRVVVFGSEGATDESMYQRVVGRPWREIAA